MSSQPVRKHSTGRTAWRAKAGRMSSLMGASRESRKAHGRTTPGFRSLRVSARGFARFGLGLFHQLVEVRPFEQRAGRPADARLGVRLVRGAEVAALGRRV